MKKHCPRVPNLWVGKLFEGDFADRGTEKGLLMSMGGRAFSDSSEDPYRREGKLYHFNHSETAMNQNISNENSFLKF